jgi:inorganic pyrophosphatase
MNTMSNLITGLLLLIIFTSCDPAKNGSKANKSPTGQEIENAGINLLADVIPLHADGHVNAVIEITAGTHEKWELNKISGELEWEFTDNEPRIIKYLGYPCNYGFIPQTLVSKEKGGDGDPLDIIILGPPVERGKILKCKLIGILYLIDRGERDDKLIALSLDSPLYGIDDMDELGEQYNGIIEILNLWFTNYKGPGIIESKGFGDRENAIRLLDSALQEYQINN